MVDTDSACVLPCGALDLIRIVHLNGRVEEYGRPVAAGEILAANPNHVLSKPCSQPQGVVRRTILIVSPDSELERGEIYFLIPASSVPENKKKSSGPPAAPHVPTTTAPSCHGAKRRHLESESKGSSDHGDDNGAARRHLATCGRRRRRGRCTGGA
ncbi:hypothetical protein GUJ93_ZPchr0010g8282 [Zizania palustris]|uniref:Uncharacterized protein n=1 Tax=Zizania palustris TaxID=103762 RepID=A0A8J6BGL5_ZIZPA|nr:hypothetical protein GUJ93_ZPchr0010g8282 [Zizania palustris]